MMSDINQEGKNDRPKWEKVKIEILTKEDLEKIIVANARTEGCDFCGCSAGCVSFCGLYW